jgi:hypothetical protein
MQKNTKFLCFKKEPVITDKLKFDRLMFQMKIYIIYVVLLFSGTVCAGLEEVLIHAELIADIYQQFPHGCIFIINPDELQQGEN